MPFRRTIATLHQRSVGPITLAYNRQVKSGHLSLDKEQRSLVAALDSLHSSLSLSATSSRSSINNGKRSFSFIIPDEHVEIAAKYYDYASSSSTTSPSSLLWWLRNNSNSSNMSGVAMATAHSWINSISRNNTSPKGIYIHGSVGVGKSMLMDLFHSICSEGFDAPEENISYAPINRRLKRCHFHEFMLDVHQRIHAYKLQHPKNSSAAIPFVASQLAKEARLLCFDEMQITDIADAMIVKRLFTILLDLGVVVVTTSNRPPCGLYEGGINRSVFMPFIDTLQERMEVIEMGGLHDYRRDDVRVRVHDDDDALALDADSNKDTTTIPTYVCMPTNINTPSSASTQQILEEWFSKGTGETKSKTIPVAMGRSVNVRKANDSCGWFTFDELCERPLGAADYIAIAEHFGTVIIQDVPQLGGNTYNEARRFVTLIDALYEARTKLVIAAEVLQKDLFVGFDATVETNDGDEEIAIAEEGNSATIRGQESFVIREGGSSSSSSTTLIRTQNDNGASEAMEWSATGRIGVSLAQLSAVREVSFSFKRAESRLAEMSRVNWGC